MSQPPQAGAPLVNPRGYPEAGPKPTIRDREGFQDVLYGIDDVVSDWDAFSARLAEAGPKPGPRVLLVSHDMAEIENITLMALGGVVRALRGQTRYLLVNPSNCDKIDEAIAAFAPDWVGFNLYTGLTDHVFAWLTRHKLDAANRALGRAFSDFKAADRALKDAVRENGGPLRRGGKTVYAPILIGGHYNNHDYLTSWARGADYSVRGKGINLFKDILLGLFPPGVYHDPICYPNIPEFDRAGFYRDTFAQSDATKKYALSPVKSVLTALGCAYNCTYCYVGAMVKELQGSYRALGLRPPSILQDRPLEIVLREGLAIKKLDEVYGTRTTAVFDQADISLNNLKWWRELRPRWIEAVGIPFYIQARPAMLAGARGRARLDLISGDGLVAGISMAIESGDPHVRRLLLKRMESDAVILDAMRNVKARCIPLRTQAITGLPVIRPLRAPRGSNIGLVDPGGREHYYDDPLAESLRCLDLVARSGIFSREDYYWNSLYSPFPGTPLGDYSFAAGFHDGATDNKERAYMFTSECGLSCFSPEVERRLAAFHRTANFFAHMRNGRDMASRFLYENSSLNLDGFADFVARRRDRFEAARGYSKFGLMPDPTPQMLSDFLAGAYGAPEDAWFLEINRRLLPYYGILLDGLVLAAKVADRYFREKEKGTRFGIDHLARVERNHYYDNSYNMSYIPKRYQESLRRYVHENRTVPVRSDPGS
ncbi:MAG: hypothetical protein PHF00_05600 [Elusimicrobia bacterium]|nr:hypothetical protein [Elusimicrobiota bacterium]